MLKLRAIFLASVIAFSAAVSPADAAFFLAPAGATECINEQKSTTTPKRYSPNLRKLFPTLSLILLSLIPNALPATQSQPGPVAKISAAQEERPDNIPIYGEGIKTLLVISEEFLPLSKHIDEILQKSRSGPATVITGKNQSENFYNALMNIKGPTTIYINIHGNKWTLGYDSGSERIETLVSKLIEASRNGVNLGEVVIIFDSCFGGFNIAELADALSRSGITKIPVLIATSQEQSNIPRFTRALEKATKENSTVTLADIIKLSSELGNQELRIIIPWPHKKLPEELAGQKNIQYIETVFGPWAGTPKRYAQRPISTSQ